MRPAISTRDISGPIPGTVVASTPRLGASQSLPELTERFGRSFSADDIFSSGKSTHLVSRSVFLTRPEVPRHNTPERQLSPSFSASPNIGASWEDTGPVAVTGPPVTLRHGTRSKIKASLSSVTEKSIADLVDSRGIEAVGNDRRSFRDRIEINVLTFHPLPSQRTQARPLGQMPLHPLNQVLPWHSLTPIPHQHGQNRGIRITHPPQRLENCRGRGFEAQRGKGAVPDCRWERRG